MSTTKPILRWPGGKSRVLPEIHRYLPENYNYYYEPFIGGGAVFMDLKPEFAYIGDLNADLINLYRVIKYKPEALIEDLKTHAHSEDYFYALRSLDRKKQFMYLKDTEKASRFLYLNKACFNGHMRYNRQGHCNSGWGKLKKPALPSPEDIWRMHHALRGVRIGQQPFDKIKNSIRKNDFVYLDPPYDKETTTSMEKYLSDGFGLKGQFSVFSFCVWLDKIGAKFMLSNANTERINNLFRGFNVREISVTRTFSRNESMRGRVTEALITNY